MVTDQHDTGRRDLQDIGHADHHVTGHMDGHVTGARSSEQHDTNLELDTKALHTNKDTKPVLEAVLHLAIKQGQKEDLCIDLPIISQKSYWAS